MHHVILMFIRYITDILDGAVARNIIKHLGIGHLLDDSGALWEQY